MQILLKHLFTQLLVFCTVNAFAGPIHIIPEPVSITEKKGSFKFNSSTKIYCDSKDSSLQKTVGLFVSQFMVSSGIELQVLTEVTVSDTMNAIFLSLNKEAGLSNDEGYVLDVLQKRIRISAPTVAGLFYALESLKQMLPPQFYAAKKVIRQWEVPCAYILDYPQFGYRGMLLDVSRHFFSTSFIKRYLDILSHYKINTFHWHFTDSHGWRLEIKQYPKLTSVGAWRADRKGIPMTIAEATLPDEPATYGGFYSQDQVREIVQYAKDRFITVIPEIEMPGHCTAALVAYPELSDLNNKTPLLMPTGYPGDLKHNFCVGYDSTYIFLQNVLNEVMALFPSEYINIGGDEVRGEPWLNCPRCQKLMKDKNISTAKELQAYFTNRIDSFLTANNRKIIGWEEILWANVSQTSTALAWHGYEGGVDAAKKRYKVVMTPYRYTYFDFYQSDPRLEKFITYFHLFLDTVYAFNPMPAGLTEAEKEFVAGGQGCLWTENVETPGRVEYMTLPRLLALAEALWTPAGQKNYRKFIDKVENEFARLSVQKVEYAKSLYNVSVAPELNTGSKKISVVLSDQAANKYPIHYTTDGTVPTSRSPRYVSPLVVNKSLHLKTALVDPQKKIPGTVNEDVFVIHKATGVPLKILPATNEKEAEKAFTKLVDGIYGTVEPYDGRWISFTDSVVSVTIDLERRQSVRSIRFSCMEDQVGNAFLPRHITFATSGDGINFKSKGAIHNRKIPEKLLRHTVQVKKEFAAENTRYVRLIFHNANINKDDRVKNLIFVDEIVVQ